jgi:tetraacyldisaccharide 4'-kinase
MSALSRASAVVITRKSADDSSVQNVERAVKLRFPRLPIVVASLDPAEIVLARSTDERKPVGQLSGMRVCAIAAVGNPGAFFEQLECVGAQVTRQAYPDHHPFSNVDVARLAAASRSVDYLVCTLKDAVKLEPLWPADAGRLWYVSLAVAIESGKPAIEELLARLARRKNAV